MIAVSLRLSIFVLTFVVIFLVLLSRLVAGAGCERCVFVRLFFSVSCLCQLDFVVVFFVLLAGQGSGAGRFSLRTR